MKIVTDLSAVSHGLVEVTVRAFEWQGPEATEIRSSPRSVTRGVGGHVTDALHLLGSYSCLNNDHDASTSFLYIQVSYVFVSSNLNCQMHY
jgi:hypothetical protein